MLPQLPKLAPMNRLSQCLGRRGGFHGDPADVTETGSHGLSFNYSLTLAG
jgi:hypothetical protein